MRAARSAAGMKPLRQRSEMGRSRQADSPPGIPLVLRQTPGCETGDLQQGKKAAISARELRAMNAARRLNSQAAPQGLPFERLEPYDGKLSRTVLRGERGRKAPDLPGTHNN